MEKQLDFDVFGFFQHKFVYIYIIKKFFLKSLVFH